MTVVIDQMRCHDSASHFSDGCLVLLRHTLPFDWREESVREVIADLDLSLLKTIHCVLPNEIEVPLVRNSSAGSLHKLAP